MPVTVRNALELEPFKQCELIAGAGGLDHIILYAGSMEVPNITPWLSRDLLLITTGYSIKNHPDSVARLIRDLHNAGSAGLAIKTKFIGDIPREAVSLAEELNIPLLRVPDDMAFINLFTPLMNAISWEQNVRLRESHFFIDIITQNVKNEEEARFRAKNLGWPSPPVTLLVFDIDQFEELAETRTEDELHHIKEGIVEIIDGMICREAGRSAVILKSDSFTALVPGSCEKAQIKGWVRDIQCESSERFGVVLTAGIAESADSYLGLQKSYDDARDAIYIARIEKRRGRIAFCGECRLEQALLHLKGNGFLKEYVQSTIEIMEEYDRKNHTELLATLRELIACMGVKTKAAERLFLHRNTLLYRIKKIEALTGFRLSEPEELISLGIALKIRPYI